ncbi:MAG: hypothetical protein PW735_09045 [Acidobacteriaceae bacterium]|nr:hypothetical protein [Acidobacteriaceae bacterium]
MPVNPPSDLGISGVPQWLVRTALCLLTLLLVVHCLHGNHLFFYDDAYITLRYSKHVLEGFGPIWNTQGPRVEGYTSPLHMLLIAGVGMLHVPLVVAARTVNFASHFVLVFFLFYWLRRYTGVLGALLGSMLVAASWIFLIWDLGGLDEILYACLSCTGILTGLRYLDRNEPRRLHQLYTGTVLLCLATLARPDGGLLLVGLWLLVALTPQPMESTRLKPLAIIATIAAVLVLPLILFRWFFFHALLPNTAYAKIGGISHMEMLGLGAHYLVHFLTTPPYLGLLSAVVALWALVRGRFTAIDAALWFFVALELFFILASGGDHMVAFRFCIPVYSLLAVLFVRHLHALDLLTQARLLPAVLGVTVVALALQTRAVSLNPHFADPASTVGLAVGRYIRDHWKPDSVVALNTAGATPFTADSMTFIDMLGLNDREIAQRKDIPVNGPWTHRIGHLKADAKSVLRRKPDYIILGTAEGTTPDKPEKGFFFGDWEMTQQKQFQEDYRPCRVQLPEGNIFTYYKDITRLGTECP